MNVDKDRSIFSHEINDLEKISSDGSEVAAALGGIKQDRKLVLTAITDLNISKNR